MTSKKDAQPQRAIVGVVIPAYNYSGVVTRAIESIKSQTLTNFACVIVDDGSTDDTANVVAAAIKDDPRFQYFYQNNAGVANARNRGVFSAFLYGTKYVTCLDADDQLDPRFLEACVRAMEEDRTIDIAYTGLWYIKPDGEEGLSPWPTDFDPVGQLEGRNQIPTCNMARRKVWERLGGQRQRYAPDGAGEEDGEMWLRALGYGFRARKITEVGLFIYSWQSGRVSGNKHHRITNYRGWHPWTRDDKLPFACIVPAKKFSHPVRQYDEPLISVIIPVGPGHEREVITALDSLDAQEFREWEAVVYWDTDESPDFILRTFPHIRLVQGGNGRGAGYARNRAVEQARAPLLVFLDADDWLVPTALKNMFNHWRKSKQIIYTDYYGLAVIDEKLSSELRLDDRLEEYDPKTGNAVIRYQALPYECERAQIQPDPKAMYIWGTVTMLIPKAWHDAIGGFDESMESWEDWDYQIRLARAGRCFLHVPGREVVYRFNTGNRREAGLRKYADLVQYMRGKYEADGDKKMGCSCGKSVNVPVRTPLGLPIAQGQFGMSDDDLVLCIYTSRNVGQHRVIGGATGKDYGYRGGGERFLVLKADIALESKKFQPVEVPVAPGVTMPEEDVVTETPPPTPIAAEVSASPLPPAPKRRARKSKAK